MSIARFSVQRPVAVTMRIASLVLLGAICLSKLPIDLLPKVSIPTVAVITQWPNVAPEELETQITRPVEEAVSSAPNIDNVTSSTTTGISVVRVNFVWGTDIGQAAIDVLQLVERARTNFPTDPTLSTPVVFKYDPSTLPIRIYGVSGIDDPVKLRTVLDNQVTPLLESANGVASAVVSGGLKRAIIIDVNPDRLKAYHLTLDQVSRRIVQENIDLPAGIAKQGATEYTIRSLGYILEPSRFNAIPVGSYGGQLVSLGQVAQVRDANLEQRIYTRLNNDNAVGVIITKQSAANTVTTAHNVDNKIKQIQKIYPNLKFGLAYDQAQFIENSIEDVKNSALIGGLLAIIILMLFLRNFRSTFVVALSIPISIISTFALLYMCGFTINTISLSGLALATGLIVDDAVVVLENIFRHIERDKQKVIDACISGTEEITGAVVASTLTIMVVFLPLFFIKGQAGQTFTQFALVVIFSIAISLLDAVTVVPMLASRMISEEQIARETAIEHGDSSIKLNAAQKVFLWFGHWFDELDKSYHNGLRWGLKHRWAVLGLSFVLSGASFMLLNYIGTETMPQTDSGDFTVIIKLPVSSALSETNAAMIKAEHIVSSDPDVATCFTAAGTTLSLRGTSTTQTAYQGSMTVKLKEVRKHSTQEVIKSLQQKLGKSITGARVLVTPFDLVTQILTGGTSNVETDIFGPDITELARISKELMEKFRQIPGLESVDTNIQDATPEMRWEVDREKALQLGVTFQDIAGTLNTATSGDLSTYYQEGGFQYPIYVQVPENRRKSATQLQDLPISTSSAGVTPPGQTILLGQVAHPVIATGPSEITRLDRQRYIAITGRAAGRSEGEIQTDIASVMNKYSLPQGYFWDFGITQKQRKDEFSGLGLAVFMAIALIYMLLASQFESFVMPLTVLVSVPLSSSGVLLGLFLTNRAFGLTAFIGLLMLIGIVVKNGILLVDYTNQLRSRGLPRNEAVLKASPTRLRPILMTASAAILGMLPMALAIGKGSETEAPLATAVIGGLTTSTLMTLFVVPVVYTLFDDLTEYLRRKRGLDTVQLPAAPVEQGAATARDAESE